MCTKPDRNRQYRFIFMVYNLTEQERIKLVQINNIILIYRLKKIKRNSQSALKSALA